MKCRYFCRLPLDISPVYLTRGISDIFSRAFEAVALIFRAAASFCLSASLRRPEHCKNTAANGGYMLEKGNKLVCADEQCGYVEAREKKDED